MKMKTAKGKHYLRRFALCILSAIMVMTAMPLTASAYDRQSELFYYDYVSDFVESVDLKNAKQEAILEYIYADYLNGNDVYKGAGECYGYAESIRKLFGTSYKQRNYGIKPTTKNVYKKLKNLRPGTHIRFTAKKNGGGTAHSVVLLKITKKYIWYTDGNVDYNGAIRYAQEPLGSFCDRQRYSGRKYFVWSREPRGSIPKHNEVSVKTNSFYDGPETHVSWLPVKKTKKYIVYRSSMKKSGYKKIAVTKKCCYIDKSENLYGKAFYKIKAVKSSGKGITSKPAKALRKVKSPAVYMTTNYEGDYERVDFTWNAVPGAKKYNIYKWNSEKEKATLLKTVSGTSWSRKVSEDTYDEYLITAATNRTGSESCAAWIY